MYMYIYIYIWRSRGSYYTYIYNIYIYIHIHIYIYTFTYEDPGDHSILSHQNHNQNWAGEDGRFSENDFEVATIQKMGWQAFRKIDCSAHEVTRMIVSFQKIRWQRLKECGGNEDCPFLESEMARDNDLYEVATIDRPPKLLYVYIYIYLYTYMYTYIYIYIYICIYMCVCVYIFMYIFEYI